MEFEVILQCENHCKSFPGTCANDNISLSARKGEIHCLLGENGAGKSTLAECLYGALKPDSGKILFRGQSVKFSSPRDAIALGIGMIHQNFDLVPVMTVLENIVVGTDMPGFILKLDRAKEKINSLCEKYSIDLPLDAKVSSLAMGQQQWVEILKTLYVGVDFLILDEPTSVLMPQEIKKLFAILQKMRAEGFSIILITHKLNEVMEISDRVSVLRKGKLTNTVNTLQTSKEALARMMVGRDIVFKIDRNKMDPGEIVLNIHNLSTSKKKGKKELQDINLQIRRKEILGLAGVSGNGQRLLFDVIVGVLKSFDGVIELDNEDVTHFSPDVLKNKGIASIPEDRLNDGLLMGLSVRENLILGEQRKPCFISGLFQNYKKIDAFAQQKIAEFDIAVNSSVQKTRNLSGGNLQKLILARELAHQPKFIIAHQPTRGLDVGAIEYVHRCILNLRERGAGILLISEELDEIFNLADRIAVIYKGRIMGVFNTSEVTLEQVGFLMAGLKKEV